MIQTAPIVIQAVPLVIQVSSVVIHEVANRDPNRASCGLGSSTRDPGRPSVLRIQADPIMIQAGCVVIQSLGPHIIQEGPNEDPCRESRNPRGPKRDPV